MMLEASTGSSPHTWGIPCLAHDLGLVVRFIPTYVGHTRFCNRDRGTFAVHPHIRGAYSNNVSSTLQTSWFIPTYVGHTAAVWVFSPAASGSSPPTWGIRLRIVLAYVQRRFIPTYVGHTCSMGIPGKMGSVHPHLRGAYVRSSSTRVLNFGSSPPTWGIPGSTRRQTHQHRFIPTYVGHTLDRRKKNGWFQPLLL